MKKTNHSNHAVTSIEQGLSLAMQHHNAGDLGNAEMIYRQVLHHAPNHPVALHLLGVLAHQAGDNVQAIDLIKKSLSFNPKYAEAHNNLGLVLQSMGRMKEAIDNYRSAIKINAKQVDAHYNLANALEDIGQLDKAIDHYTIAINLNPQFAEAHYNLGNVYKDTGQLTLAAEHYRKTLKLTPQQAEANFSLGIVEERTGQWVKSIEHYCKAIEINPSFFEAYRHLAYAYCQLEHYEDAICSFQNALRIKPDDALIHFDLGNVYQAIGQLNNACMHYRKSIIADPENASAHNSLGDTLKNLGLHDDAIMHFHTSIKIDPSLADTYNKLGSTLRMIGKLDDAIENYLRAINLNPEMADAYNNLGNVCLVSGRLAEAIEHYRKAIDIKPDFSSAHSNLLLSLQYCVGIDSAELKREHEKWWQMHGQDCTIVSTPNSRCTSAGVPLKVGFLSPDFRQHPVGFLAIKLLENTKSKDIQIFCYADQSISDSYTERFKSASYKWVDVFGLSDEKLTKKIKSDKIDILIDLTGHSANNRLSVFCRKPAPVQVSWCGYVCTTGLPTIDYIVADRFHILPEEEKFYTEKVRRLPNSAWCYDAPDIMPEVGPLPALQNGFITFGSFNNPSKLNDQLLASWCRILDKTPKARLLLKYSGMDSPYNKTRILEPFEQHGIDPSRIILEGHSPFPELLARYNSVDIALDTLPYSGGVTTCEALWMGVPVVTYPGQTYPGRHSQSHLNNIGMNELVAGDMEGYVNLANKLASDVKNLSRLRNSIRKKMKISPLCDGQLFAKSFLKLMREICLEKTHRENTE